MLNLKMRRDSANDKTVVYPECEKGFMQKILQEKCPAAIPPIALGITLAHQRSRDAQAPCWPVSGLVNIRLSPSQACVQNAQWLSDSASILTAVDGLHIASLTVAGAAQLRLTMNGSPSCFPLNCGM
jgi:hypothetical protein